MGAISSMCCEGEDPKKKQPKDSLPSYKDRKDVPIPVPTCHTQRKKEQLTENIQKNDRQRSKSKERLKKDRKEEDYAAQIQQIYPPPPDKKSVKWENFQINCKIGGGGFGEVFLAELKENKDKGFIEKYAIKRVLKSEIIKKKLTANLQLEKRILQESKSNFITSLYYAFRDEKFLYFVMQWAQGGDTYSLICQGSKRVEDFKAAGENAVRFILACLILGMEQLHSKNIMYRDLKPQNVLIFQNGYVKLTDFGLAKQIRDDELSKTEAGTNIYYAPEMVLKEGYGKAIDFWTIGIYAYEMSNFSPPFSGQEIKDRLKVKKLVKYAEQNRTWKNQSISEELKSFINDLLKFQPKQRLGYKGWNDMKEHKFFKCVKFDWKALSEMKMQSPIKPIIDKHKLKYKPYNPNELPKKWAADATLSSGNNELEGWTYVYEKQ